MAILHTVNRSPFERSSLDSCLGTMQPNASLLLIEDGVYAASRGTVHEHKIRDAQRRFKIYVLRPDLAARGLSEDSCIEGIEFVDYDGFVDLAVNHDTVNAWL